MPVKRMVFHEITPQAIQQAIEQPPRHRPPPGRRPGGPPHRSTASTATARWPTWPARRSGRAARVGRVQSVGTRLVVERERERMRVRRRASYWDLDGEFATGAPPTTPAHVRRHPGRSSTATAWPAGKDFGEDGRRPRRRGRARRGPAPRRWPPSWPTPSFAVRSVERRPYRRRPVAAVHHLDLPAGGRAQAAALVVDGHAVGPEPLRGRLHHLHADRLDHAVGDGADRGPGRDRRALRRASTCPTQPRRYAKKVKNAQEAHEAIRPAGDTLPLARAGGPRGRAGPTPRSTS